MLNLWKRLGQYEKTVLALLLGFIIFSAGYFSVSLSGARCPLCQNKFEPNESYLGSTEKAKSHNKNAGV